MPSRRVLKSISFAIAHAVALIQCASAVADDVDYEKQIKPLFAARCIACHGVLKQEAGLRLDTGQLARQGSSDGSVLSNSEGKKSVLLERVTASETAQRMPPEGEPLTAVQIEQLTKWIASGAQSPNDEQPEADPRDHWAFREVVRPDVPTQSTSWGRNPIDSFIAAGHLEHGLQAQSPANRLEQIRRLYVDLIGIPPTAEDWQAIADDTRDGWYERLVERLLEDPRYGQRWARHWMDVWRYSDWWGLGQQLRNSQLHMWHWRDWIVQSLNDDLHYDEMIRLMLAADELAPTDTDKLRATGFLARNFYLFNRHQWMDETVEHTSKALLGLTMNCAKCHDHKYDPINQTDYYRMRAFFEPYYVRMDMLPGESDLARNGLPRIFESQAESPTYLFVRGQETQPDKTRIIAPGLPELFDFHELKIEPRELPATAWQPERNEYVSAGYLHNAEQRIAEATKALTKARQQVQRLRETETQRSSRELTTPRGAADNSEYSAIEENFDELKPTLWHVQDGEWIHESGQVRQAKDGPTRSVLRLLKTAPVDFEASVKFMIQGGSRWRSVCLSFDASAESNGIAASDTLQTVYVSGVEGGSKLQASFTRNGKWEYPADGAVPQAIALNQPYTLRIQVRGRLVNAYLNDEFILAWQTPLDRRPGHVLLETYDALASFDEFKLDALGADVILKPAKDSPKNPAAELANLEKSVAFAEQDLAIARAGKQLVQLQLAAMKCDWELQDAANLATEELARLNEQAIAAHHQAIKHARQLDVKKAERTLAGQEAAMAEQTGAKRDAAAKKVKAAKESLEKAQQLATAELKPTDKAPKLFGAKWTPTRFLNSGADDPAVVFGPKSSGRRTALAEWITDRRNPLTARVAVNQIWMRHMGGTLVETPFDFGRKTPAPRHQALLDWMAAEFMDSGWSMKHLHRLIVNSDTYRMSSSQAERSQNIAKDPDNLWIWRRQPIRIESQVVRDGILALAGALDCTTGGPPVMPSDQAASHRRSLYFFHSNNERNLFLTTFDEAPVNECYRREQSIVPQQALALTNSQLVLDSVGQITERVAQSLPKEAVTSDERFVEHAFHVILGIDPSEAERKASLSALNRWREIGDDPKRGPRELLVWALLNHNDFVTLR